MNERVLKEATCPSLSGRSVLTYQVGAVGKALHLRISANSGSGHFGREWVPLSSVMDLLGEAEEPFTWEVLQPLFEGRSLNTAGFLLAALRNEGVVRDLEGSPLRYGRADPGAFKEEMDRLMPKRPRKKAPTEAEERSPT